MYSSGFKLNLSSILVLVTSPLKAFKLLFLQIDACIGDGFAWQLITWMLINTPICGGSSLLCLVCYHNPAFIGAGITFEFQDQWLT